jgi:hypothetical protein
MLLISNEVGTCNGFIVIVMVASVKRWARPYSSRDDDNDDGTDD